MPKLIRLKNKENEKNQKEFNDFMFIRKLDLLSSDRYSPEEEDAFMEEIIKESDRQLAIERINYGNKLFLDGIHQGKNSVTDWPLVISINLGFIGFAAFMFLVLKFWS